VSAGAASIALRLRSVGASVVSTAVDIGLFALLSFALTGLVSSAALLAGLRWLSGAAGALANFALNRWAFGAARARLGQQGLRYAAVAAAAVTLAAGVFFMLARLTPADPRLLSVASLALVWLCFTFPLLRRWVFARR